LKVHTMISEGNMQSR